MSRTSLAAATYLCALIGFAVLTGSLIGCSGEQDAETTPDVAARLETRAKEAARDAQEALESAAGDAREALDEAAEEAGTALNEAADEAGAAMDQAAEEARELASAAGDALPDVGAGPVPAATQAGDADCFELFDQGAYAEAVAACTAALLAKPEDAKLKETLAAAREEAGTSADDAADALSGLR